jgi:hypothetical protein
MVRSKICDDESLVAWACWACMVEECSVSRSGQGETKVCKWSQPK